jgi:hypothetical protein
MSKMHNHYDDLKVARDAPVEVIRAAYKSLSQKFHPDRNGDNVHFDHVMRSINVAYDVLSDPARRRAHDALIDSSALPGGRRAEAMRAHLRRTKLRYGSALLALFGALLGGVALLGQAPLPASETGAGPQAGATGSPASPPPASRNAAFVAPNGAPWPDYAAYITGYEVLKTQGQASITVDNSDGDSDLFAKLVSLEPKGALVARCFFVPAHSRFVLANVSGGIYDIRFRQLASGALWRSAYFRTDDGAAQRAASALTVSPSNERGGKASRFPLADSEF